MANDSQTNVPGREAYWRRARRLSAWLLAAWFFLTFLTVFFARELADITLFGWTFPFYMAAQGLPLLYLLMVAVYEWRMRRLDRWMKGEARDGK